MREGVVAVYSCSTVYCTLLCLYSIKETLLGPGGVQGLLGIKEEPSLMGVDCPVVGVPLGMGSVCLWGRRSVCLSICMLMYVLTSSPSLTPGMALPSLSVRQLFRMLNETPDLVLVLDCRTRVSYTASHTDVKKCPQWLSIPEELVLKG